MSQTVTATYTEGMAFDIEVSGHTLKADSLPDFGGEDRGPTPKSFLLAGLAGCTGMDVVAILGKMQVPYDTFGIQIEAESAETHPHVYTKVHVIYRFTGSELETGKIEKAITLSLNKYCPVAATLKHTAEITHELVTAQP